MLFDQFCQIDSLHFTFQPGNFDCILHIDETERTGGDNHVSTGLFCHFSSEYPHSLVFFRFVEKHQTTSTTTKGAVPALVHFHPLQALDGVQHFPRYVVEFVMSPKIAGIVVGVDFIAVFHRFELECIILYLGKECLADMADRREIPILVFQAVVCVGISCDDFLCSRFKDRGPVVLAQSLE